VPPHLQRFRSEDLLAAVFPETVGCLENHHGDVEIPDHPLLQQTIDDCLYEGTDLPRWLAMLDDQQAGRVRFHARDTREPSPFSHQLLNANPYAFLDPADLEERRTRAVSMRRSLSSEAFKDLARLDPEAIKLVVSQAWPVVRDADEAHDALLNMVMLPESDAAAWQPWLKELAGKGRAARVTSEVIEPFWTAAEQVPMLSAVYPDATCTPAVKLPAELQREWSKSDGWVEIAKGLMQYSPPTTAAALAERLGLAASSVAASLEALESTGTVLRGCFTAESQQVKNGSLTDPKHAEWCDRRLLARIHRVTLDGLRRQIQPVEVTDYLRFLVQWHRLDGNSKWNGPEGTREVLGLLQGFETSAGAWESRLIAPRLADYDPAWLDQLFISGEAMWGRLQRPKREESKRGSRRNAMTRAAPVSLMFREHLPWLVDDPVHDAASVVVPVHDAANVVVPVHDAASVVVGISGKAQQVYEALQQRGALFQQELAHLTGLLPTELEDALRELAAAGLVASDAFGAIREIVAKPKRNAFRKQTAPMLGRWSCFPGLVTPETGEARIERWCRQLLRRYGVIFRDLLVRESAAPSWYEMIRTLRRLELRGEVRGGRFVSGVSGEQYASEDAVTRLRKTRDTKPDGSWTVLSAADPLNLRGIVTKEDRVTANHKNALLLRDGKFTAVLVAGQIEFTEDVDLALRHEMSRALRMGRRAEPSPGLGLRRKKLPPGA